MILLSEDPRIAVTKVELQRVQRTTKTGRYGGKMVTLTLEDGNHVQISLVKLLTQNNLLDVVLEKTGILPKKRSSASWDLLLVQLLNQMTLKGVM